MRSGKLHNLLIVGNFSPDVGYAWNTIGAYFEALGGMFVSRGHRAMICFPEVRTIPTRFAAAGMEVLEFDFGGASLAGLYHTIRKNGIRTIYITDRPTFSLRYFVSRLAGARRIIVHDRTSGERDRPGPIKRVLKDAINAYPLFSADIAIGISDFVTRRLIQVSRFPAGRTYRIWNGIDVGKYRPGFDDHVFRRFDIDSGKKIVFSASRANRYKGIHVLIEAADILVREKGREDLVFLYSGDGPDLGHFRTMVSERNLEGVFLCPGRTDDIDRILRGVAIVAVPALWEEGFGLSVVEGMATGKPVIASRAGGIVEILADGRHGFLVEPGDARTLADRIEILASDDDMRNRLGDAARREVESRFNIEDKKRELMALFRQVCFDEPGDGPVPGSRGAS